MMEICNQLHCHFTTFNGRKASVMKLTDYVRAEKSAATP